MKTAVAYIRVSTSAQGKSGLGLEAQQAALARFADAEGYQLLQTFEEVETGKGADALERRPQLAEALRIAKRHKAPIIVAKLAQPRRALHQRIDDAQDALHRGRAGRRRRSLHAARLRRARGKERRIISQRTKDALAAKKAQGVKLGGLNAKGIANREHARERAEQLRPVFAELAGLSHGRMAQALNERSVPTLEGRPLARRHRQASAVAPRVSPRRPRVG
jgi:DNA invertase Pin-like site-specific DNA recombinase